MTQFIWPSDADRAENDELNRVCEHLEEVLDERDDVVARYHLLASEMVYEGNSVQHWCHKARAYKECAGAISKLKEITGTDSPDAVVEAVNALAAKLVTVCEAVTDVLIETTNWQGDNKDLWAAVEEAPRATLDRIIAENKAEGMNKAALFIEQKADAYNAEHGTTDPTTGAREYPGDGAEYYNNLMELAEELRQQAEELSNG